jgi:hypothetical protein
MAKRMKKLLAILLAFLSGHSRADAPKLGSEADPIRQMLFASQSLKEQANRIDVDGAQGPFQITAEASKLVDEGKKAEAIARLRTILAMPDLETRIHLWAWSALRELGEKPESRDAFEVLGAILEVPSGDGWDTLAGYVDGSARYLNFSGKAIFWDAGDAKVKGLCQALVDSTIPTSSGAKPRANLSLPKRDPQVTLLTRSGSFVIPNPPEPVIRAAAALMLELIDRSKKETN